METVSRRRVQLFTTLAMGRNLVVTKGTSGCKIRNGLIYQNDFWWINPIIFKHKTSGFKSNGQNGKANLFPSNVTLKFNSEVQLFRKNIILISGTVQPCWRNYLIKESKVARGRDFFSNWQKLVHKVITLNASDLLIPIWDPIDWLTLNL